MLSPEGHLRHALQLRLVSPRRGRYYLHKHMRIVFSMMSTNLGEQLEHVIDLPRPRFWPLTKQQVWLLEEL